jgi:hypothetical protein
VAPARAGTTAFVEIWQQWDTQALERPSRRPPLQHALDSIDTLREYMDPTESPLDFDDITSTLVVGVEILTESLWPEGGGS